MNIIEKRLTEITPYEKNPRRNDEAVKYVAESIKRFGFKNPIVIDRNGVIVAGHTRYRAAMELGMEEVPCIIADDLTDEQVKAYRLADNKVAEKASWDYELLNVELEELLDFNMEALGFDMSLDEIDWADVDELTEKTYEEPKKTMLKCPVCNHVDSKNHFQKVEEE